MEPGASNDKLIAERDVARSAVAIEKVALLALFRENIKQGEKRRWIEEKCRLLDFMEKPAFT